MNGLLSGGLLGLVRKRQSSYIQQVLNTLPIAFWPLNETSGTTAINYGSLGTAANGSYTGVTLANAAAPGGGMCPYFDGVNDFLNIYSTSFANAFNGAVGSFATWVKVYTGLAGSDVLHLDVDGNIYINIAASATQFLFFYACGGQTEAYTFTGDTTGWTHIVITWSKANDRVRYYVNSVLKETDTTLGTWSGSLLSNGTVMGVYRTDNQQNDFKGWLAKPAVWTTELDQTTITALYSGGL